MKSASYSVVRIVLIVSILIASAMSCTTTEGQATTEEDWVELFNGENLDGWDV